MNVKRKVAVTVLMGAGLGLAGCQSPTLGGLAFWNKSGSVPSASAAPDVGKQRYEGLSKEFGSQSSRTASSVGLGGQKPPETENFLTASWKKTTTAVGGAFAAKPKTEDSPNDPLRLDSPAKKVGPEVHVAAARLLENQSKFDQAQAEYEKALKLAPNDVNAIVGLARLHDRQGRSREALGLYQKALKAQPKNGLVYNDLGLCYARQKQVELALGALGKAVELQPDNAKYRNNLATVLVDSGREEEALKHLTMATPPAVAHYNIGFLLAQKGRSGDALRHCQQALAIDPSLTPAREMMARLGGNFDAAPMAAQPESQSADQSGVAQFAPRSNQPAFTVQPRTPQSAAMAPADSGLPYAAGATGQEVYTGAPQVPASVANSPLPSFHIGDDGAAAQTASRPSSAEWSYGGTTKWGTMQPLPPVE
jgi:tetratricopeptide (TPR) repeat protein